MHLIGELFGIIKRDEVILQNYKILNLPCIFDGILGSILFLTCMSQLGLKLKAKPIKIRGMTRDNKNDINKDLTIYGSASTVQIRKNTKQIVTEK